MSKLASKVIIPLAVLAVWVLVGEGSQARAGYVSASPTGLGLSSSSEEGFSPAAGCAAPDRSSQFPDSEVEQARLAQRVQPDAHAGNAPPAGGMGGTPQTTSAGGAGGLFAGLTPIQQVPRTELVQMLFFKSGQPSPPPLASRLFDLPAQ